jgi:lysozyme
MKVTEAGLSLIRESEGFRERAYRDAVGVWTIGYGHTSAAGAPHVTPAMRVTRAEAEDILARDVAMFVKGVRKLLACELADEQFSALVSFAYNVGLTNFAASSVLKAVNSGDFDAVPRRLALWVKAGGRTLPGLVRRRAAEAALFAGFGDASSAPETPRGKPTAKSRTIWSAIIVILVAIIQFFVEAAEAILPWLLLLIILAGAAVIIRERIIKLKEEGI